MIWATATKGPHAAPIPLLMGIAGAFGAILGALILPVAGFTLLRYVPLGRALAETIVATALGAGFGVAATRLWALARRARARQYAALELEP